MKRLLRYTATVALLAGAGAGFVHGTATGEDARPAAAIKGKLTVSGMDLQKPDLSRAVIYLASDALLDKEPPPEAAAQVVQKDKKFVPEFLVVQRNTNVEFPNQDPFDHNVFSRSKAAPAFDLQRYPRGMSKSRVFDNVGVVQVFCNIHPSMRAIIVVTPNKYFTRADSAGNFTIEAVPPGRYTLVAWQERCEESRKEIQLPAQGLSGIALDLKESRQAIMSSERPAGKPAYGLDQGLGVRQEKLNLPVVTEVHPAPATAPCCDH